MHVLTNQHQHILVITLPKMMISTTASFFLLIDCLQTATFECFVYTFVLQAQLFNYRR